MSMIDKLSNKKEINNHYLVKDNEINNILINYNILINDIDAGVLPDV